jgi:Uma2 family endonuclease
MVEAACEIIPAMGRQATLVSVAEYLHTAYRPDCDYVEGVVTERNVGEKDHGKAQRELLFYLHERREEWNIFVIQAQRVQISPTRYRVPDICVVAGPEPEEQIFTRPPFLCIEILSPEDRMSRMQEKIDEYLAFGVSFVWLIDPQTRKAWVYTTEVIREVRDGLLRTESPPIVVPLEKVFK